MSQVVQPEDAEPLFRDSVSAALLHRITSIIVTAYGAARETASKLAAPPFYGEITPWVRRASVHTELKALEAIFPDLRVEILRPSTSSVTVSLQVGRVQLLVARAVSPNVMIPASNYRRAIATRSLQGSLFEAPEPTDAKLYAVVLHGGDQGGPIPSFIVARFPTADHASYLEVKVDMLAEFSAVAGTGIEQITPTHKLSLKKPNAKEGESA